MKKQDIISEVKKLNLKKGSYVVFGGAPLAAVGIREANDIDLFVSDEVLQKLKKAGWEKLYKGPRDEPYTKGIFEAHKNWEFSPYRPTLKHLLKTADYIDGVAFASIEEVRKWKEASGGVKHNADVKLIDEYLNSRKF